MNNELERELNKAVVACFKELPQHLLGVPKETSSCLHHDRRCPHFKWTPALGRIQPFSHKRKVVHSMRSWASSTHNQNCHLKKNILPSPPRPSHWSFAKRFLYQNSVCTCDLRFSGAKTSKFVFTHKAARRCNPAEQNGRTDAVGCNWGGQAVLAIFPVFKINIK